MEKTVVFAPGCTWMLCRIIEGDVRHIYLRELSLPLTAPCPILWLDDRLHFNSFKCYMYWFNDWNRDVAEAGLQETRSLIVKTHVQTATAYLNSIFFKISLYHSQSFKLIQSLQRENENLIRRRSHPGEIREGIEAPLFMKRLRDTVLSKLSSNYSNLAEKVQIIIFEGRAKASVKEDEVIREAFEVEGYGYLLDGATCSANCPSAVTVCPTKTALSHLLGLHLHPSQYLFTYKQPLKWDKWPSKGTS